jgi:hypothetical protein
MGRNRCAVLEWRLAKRPSSGCRMPGDCLPGLGTPVAEVRGQVWLTAEQVLSLRKGDDDETNIAERGGFSLRG